nr:hypothetical protein [Nitrospiraceae bacterium]
PVVPSPANGSQGAANNSQSSSPTAPSFMDSAVPNSQNPFLPSNIAPGLNSAPLQNAYLQNGVPQLAAPLMSVVYRPFGLTYFQPNPFQVVPQGSISLTGTFETDTNINFSPTQPETGSLYTITPAVMYSNFDDYGYISLIASASYVGYDTGNISPYLDELGGITVGTYLGTKVFFGAQDLFMYGSSPQMTGQPLAFFNGINGYYENVADAEVGVALTPKITFVQAASDMYGGFTGFGAGIMNLESLTDSLNYVDYRNFLSATYMYQQGFFTDFPGFISNGVMGTAMRTVSPSTSLGVGASYSDYLYQNLPTFNMNMATYYGILTHRFTRSVFFSAMGGWDYVEFANGQSFQSPMGDMNLGYTGSRESLGINVGYFMENQLSYGIEMGPSQTAMALGYFTYKIGPKTSFYSSIGYSYYDFLAPAPFSNSFFHTLQPNISYNGTFIDQTDTITYTPKPWMSTSLMYNLIDFSTNIPNETIIDNQFIAMVSFFWNFK